MFETFATLVVLFMVIIDPPLSLAFFMANTKGMRKSEKMRTAFKAIALAFGIVLSFVLFGELFLRLFSIDMAHFRVAGGIILLLLGIRMALGLTLRSSLEDNDVKDAIPAIIATPLISGPACITTLLISSFDHGKAMTAIAASFVLLVTGGMLLAASLMDEKSYPKTAIKMMTTMMGLVTITWGISFIMEGLGL